MVRALHNLVMKAQSSIRQAPPEDLEYLGAVIFRQPTRKQSILTPVWGRLGYGVDVGRYQGPAIVLEALSTESQFRWPRSLAVESQRELARLRLDEQTEAPADFWAPLQVEVVPDVCDVEVFEDASACYDRQRQALHFTHLTRDDVIFDHHKAVASIGLWVWVEIAELRHDVRCPDTPTQWYQWIAVSAVPVAAPPRGGERGRAVARM